MYGYKWFFSLPFTNKYKWNIDLLIFFFRSWALENIPFVTVASVTYMLLQSITFSRLSFAQSASKIKEKARIVALDFRGHGKSVTENDLDLSIEVCACQTVTERKMIFFKLLVLIIVISLRHLHLHFVVEILNGYCRHSAMMWWLLWRQCMGILLRQLWLLATGCVSWSNMKYDELMDLAVSYSEIFWLNNDK